MGTYDISRISFDPAKHYSSVRMQQGRVVTDADQVEDESIHAEEQRRTQVDIIGSYGTPDDGFKIGDPELDATSGFIDFDIAEGTIYLGGIRFEMDEPETYMTQKDWLHWKDDPYKIPELDPGKEQFDLVYLEAWQQYVCAIEDSSLFETALGGPDTTTRIRNMRRVKVEKNNKFQDCSLSWSHLIETWKNNHKGVIKNHELTTNLLLTVSFTQGEMEDLCSPAIAGGYLGAENQAIRVQVVRKEDASGNKKNYFTWGFDNSSPLYRVNITPGTKLVTLQTPPKDQFHWPVAEQVIEILPWSAVLPNNEKIAEETGFITKAATSYKPDEQTFELKDNLDLPLLDGQDYFYMRIWNRGSDLNSDALIEFDTTNSFPLGNTGVKITFGTSNTEEAEVITGDFWIIAFRPETPEEIFPWELKQGMHPFGVRRFYAPLAIIKWTADGNGNVTGDTVHDCRPSFDPLTHHDDCCCTYNVGDGITSRGDFNSIQDAIEHLPEQGGKLCLLPGIHTTNAMIINRKKIHISGCGIRTIVRPDVDNPVNRANPVFVIKNSQWIWLENMTIITLEGIGILLDDDTKLPASLEITIRHNYITALIHAVRVVASDIAAIDGHHIHIVYNRIYMLNIDKGDVAIFSLADDVLIERNRLSIVPFSGGGDGGGGDDGDDDDDDDECDCDETIILYRRRDLFRKFVLETIDSASLEYFIANTEVGYITKGGIQIGSGSSKVLILRNEIFGGAGHGIILGHRPQPIILLTHLPSATERSANPQPLVPSLLISEVAIEENIIKGMYLSGISSLEPAFGDTTGISLIDVADLSVYKNEIYSCALRTPAQDPGNLFQPGYGGVCLSMCADVMIRENRIEKNGVSTSEPICGVFILYGERVDISNNRILHNGKNKGDVNPNVLKGHRAGIYLRTVAQMPETIYNVNRNPSAVSLASSIPSALLNTTAAVKIHDNVVIQPLGHALLIRSVIGPVSVVSNQFTSQGADPDEKYSRIAASVLIHNMSDSSTSGDISARTLNKTAMTLNVSAAGNFSNVGTTVLPSARALGLPGKILFTANQTTFAPTLPRFSFCLTAQLIGSRDDIAFLSNQSECLPLGSLQRNVWLTHTYLFSVATVRAMSNWLGEGAQVTPLSLVTLAYMNTTADNHSTHCVLVGGVRKVDRDNLVILNPEYCKRIVPEITKVLSTH